jgi:putative flippase GtrA
MIARLSKLLLSVQFLKFLFVGVTAAAANWLSRYGFDLFMSFSLSVICAYAVGMTVAFILNAIHVFPNSKRARHLQARDFFAINIAFMPLVWIVSIGLNTLFLHFDMPSHYSEPIAHGLALGAPMILSFLLYKFVAFRDTGEV